MPSQLQKHLVNLYRGDFERLGELHNTLSPSVVIRELVRKHIEAIERRMEEREKVG